MEESKGSEAASIQADVMREYNNQSHGVMHL